MADLSPIAAEVLAELQPVLADLARMRSNGSSGVAVDQGTVTSVDRATGRCTVTLDSGAVNASATCSGYVPAPRERVWVKFVQPAGLVVDGRVHGQPGLLGFPGIATVPVALAVAGSVIATTEVQVQADRLVVVHGHVQVLNTYGFAQATSAWIEDGGVFVGTVGRRDLIAGGSEGIDADVLIWPPLAAGFHTLTLVAAMSVGTGTAEAQPIGTTPGPATVWATDLGSANQ